MGRLQIDTLVDLKMISFIRRGAESSLKNGFRTILTFRFAILEYEIYI